MRGRVRTRALQLGHLEWKSSRRRQRISENLHFATLRLVQQRLFQVIAQRGFPRERKRRAYLHARGSRCQSLTHLLSGSAATRQPEGRAQLANPAEVDRIPLAVDWLPVRVQLQLAAGRRIVPARCPRFNHQPIHFAVRLAQHGRRQRAGGNDGQKRRPPQRRQFALHEFSRIEAPGRIVAFARAAHAQRVLRGLVLRQLVQHPRHAQRNTRAHQHVPTPASIAPYIEGRSGI